MYTAYTVYSKASRYLAYMCADLADPRFLIGSKHNWDWKNAFSSYLEAVYHKTMYLKAVYLKVVCFEAVYLEA